MTLIVCNINIIVYKRTDYNYTAHTENTKSILQSGNKSLMIKSTMSS